MPVPAFRSGESIASPRANREEHPAPTGPFAQAQSRARTRGKPVLLSIVQPVSTRDPLRALEELWRSAAFDTLLRDDSGLDGMYWTRPSAGFALAGAGTTLAFTPDGRGRFAEVDRTWSALLEDAIVEDPSGGAPGTGPLLMGGFSFDAAGPSAAHWRGFPSTLLTVPRLQLALVGHACWMTTTLLIRPDGAPDVDPAELERLRHWVLGAADNHRDNAGTMPYPGSLAFPDRPADADKEWRAVVGKAVSAIRGGSFEKVVLARAVQAVATSDVDVMATLRHLRSEHPHSHVFCGWRGESAFVGASPERLVRLEGREVRASSLAGSVRRGTTRGEDAALAASLLASAKDRVEHDVVSRSLRAKLSEMCDDVVSPSEPELLTLPHVHHLHTDMRGRLRREYGLMDLVARLHPTPAVGGHPREPALRFIQEHERLDRGWYAAPIGWMGRDQGEFAVALRSALIRGSDAWLFAGCGIVADSDPDLEFQESLLKLRPMEAALAQGVSSSAAALNEPLPSASGGGPR